MEQTKFTPSEILSCILTQKIIDKDGTITKFTLLDFYLLSNETPSEFIKKCLNKCTPDEIVKIKKFFNIPTFYNGKIITYHNANDLVKIELTCNGHYFSEAEKRAIIQFLTEKNIPISVKTYFVVARKYVNGEIDLKDYLTEKLVDETLTRIKPFD